MKNLIFATAILFMGSLANAQSSKHDPTYSIHNYKHPNKATEAAKIGQNKTCTPYLMAENLESRNYKSQITTEINTTSLAETIPTENAGQAFSFHNYKSQFGKSKKKMVKAVIYDSLASCKSSERHNNFVKKSQNYKSQF